MVVLCSLIIAFESYSSGRGFPWSPAFTNSLETALQPFLKVLYSISMIVGVSLGRMLCWLFCSEFVDSFLNPFYKSSVSEEGYVFSDGQNGNYLKLLLDDVSWAAITSFQIHPIATRYPFNGFLMALAECLFMFWIFVIRQVCRTKDTLFHLNIIRSI